MKNTLRNLPDDRGYYGDYGGRFVPDTLMEPLIELERAYRAIKGAPDFESGLDDLLTRFVGRPTPLYYARRLSAEAGGAKIYLKREDLLHTGAHKINNAIGQILLARHSPMSFACASWGRKSSASKAVRPP